MTFTELKRILSGAGWVMVRQRKHQTWRCPCGKHQAYLPLSTSDHRAIKNKVAQLRKQGCPSLKGL